MKKDGVKKEFGVLNGARQGVLALVFGLVLGVFGSMPAFAQCETADPANTAIGDLVDNDVASINRLVIQEENFVAQLMSNSGFAQLASRLSQWSDGHLEAALVDWWKGLLPALTSMTEELHVAQVDQTLALGKFVDAQLMVDEKTRRGDSIINAHRRYSPSGLACEIDTTGPGQAKSYQISRALNRGLAIDDAPRHNNAVNTISAGGRGAEINKVWQEYVAKFCDNTMGDQGCTTPGTVAGRHKDMGALLWGDRQTIDPSNPDNVLTMQAALRYLIDPLASDPVPRQVMGASSGYIELLARHAELAYTNAIYNTVGGMLSEHIGGSGVNAQAMRVAAGISPAGASTDASYRELQETMTKDRYNNPEYIVRMLEDPVQVAREQGTINALRLQTMNDLYRRSEEMLFMEAAEYSRDLNGQMPGTGLSGSSLK